MTRTGTLIAALFAATAIALPALAQDAPKGPGRPDRETQRRAAFDRIDANKDGYIDRTEARAAREAIFERLDANKDGRLTTEELATARRGRGQGPKGQSGGVNTEAGGTPPAPPAASDAGKRQARADRLFQRLDGDKDGAISRTEWQAAEEARFVRCDTNKDGKLAFGECRLAQGSRRQAPAVQ